MEQSDLYLLQNVPPYHLQALVKTRRSLVPLKDQHLESSTDLAASQLSEIAQHLFDPTAIRDALQGLSDTEALILRELVSCGGRANSRDLALYLTMAGLLEPPKSKKRETIPLSKSDAAVTTGERGISGRYALQGTPPQYPAPHPHGIFEQALHRLLLLGLLFWGKQTNFVGRDYASGVYDGVLIVPQAVIEIANAAWKTDTLSPDTLSSPPSLSKGMQLGEGVRALQRTLYLYWSIVAAMREGLPLIGNKLLSRAALRHVLEHLHAAGMTQLLENDGMRPPIERQVVGTREHPTLPLTERIRTESDAPHLLFTRLLLMKLGLLYERHGVVHAAPADTFFALPLLERARSCYRLWLETAFWNELAYLPDVVLRPAPTPLESAHEEAVRARQMVIQRVLHAKPEVWHQQATFIARTKLYVPYLLFPRQYGSRVDRYSIGSNPYGWDFRLRRGWLTHREGWHLVEGAFIRSVISGPLYWLGLTELNDEEHPDAFRLSSDIALVSSDLPIQIEEPAWGRLIVQPTFELVALAPVSEALLVSLDRFAERVRLEHIAQYRLTRAAVTRAIQVGLHADAIQEVLERAAGSEIPQNVRYSLMEWERQARRIELWRGVTLLEVDDPALLDALFAGEQTRPMMSRRLTPLLAEVASDQLASIQDFLWRRDYLSALVSAPVHENLLESGRLPAHEPQWQLQPNGLLQPSHPVVDLYLAAELERFTELDETTGRRRLTPKAIAAACKAGLPLETLIRFLQVYCQGGVPASFLIRLKLWGGGYAERNTVQVERMPLLSLSAQALQDIQADEELGPLL
ncbi:MAG TPA: helicase-associated domain-containing protein, partial [Ktedonobacteraceae bacterium]|nr:helicase-associated domain-containing protein [Ktedonobacteraceae bacterium]